MSQAQPVLNVEQLNESTSFYLDILRSVLSQLVLVGHAASFFSVLHFIQPPSFPWIQAIAVVGFFWLSGFLICHSVLIRKCRGHDFYFSDFFILRFSRIYTGYISALLFVFIVDAVFIRYYPEKYTFYSSFSFEYALGNLLMLQKFPVEYLNVPMFGSASTWWTLSIEWWLYMLFGWVFIAGRARVRREVYWVTLFVFAIVPINYAVSGTGTVGIGLSLAWFVSCGFAFLKDLICVYVSRKVMLIIFVVSVVLAIVRYKISMDPYDIIASMYFGSAFLFSVCWMQGLKLNVNLFSKKIVNFVAGYSFTLFLTHYSVLYFIYSAGLLHGWGAFITSIIVSNVLAAFVAYFAEMRYHGLAIILTKSWKQLIVRK